MILSKDVEKILSVITEMSKEENYYKLLEDILEVGMSISNCDGGTLYLLNGDKLEFFFMITKSLNIKDGGVNKKIDLPPVDINSPSVAALCAKAKRIINVADVYSDKIYNWSGPKKYDELTGYHTESVLVLPLFDKEKNVLGVMQLINAVLFKKVVPFSYDVERILYSLSSLSGILLDNINLYSNTKGLLDSFVNVFVKAIEKKTYNPNYKEKVGKTITSFIDYLNQKEYDSISNNIKDEIIMASELSDVGKILLSEDDLNKINRLGSNLDNMLLRYELISLHLENLYLKDISNTVYHNKIKLISKVKDFVVKINQKNYLDDNDLAFIDEIKDEKFVINDKPYKIFTEEELDKILKYDKQEQINKYTNEILNSLDFGKKYSHVKDIISNYNLFLSNNVISDPLISKYVNVLALAYLYEDNKNIKALKEKALEYCFNKDLLKYFVEFIEEV